MGQRKRVVAVVASFLLFALVTLLLPFTAKAQQVSVRTLRYLDEAISARQLCHDDARLFNRPVDLKPQSKDWVWYPNLNPEREYRIEPLILKDGQVIVKLWITGSVLDREEEVSFGK